MSGVVILKCSCTHAYQDQKYGEGMRVCNKRGVKKKNLAICTVCKAERSFSSEED